LLLRKNETTLSSKQQVLKSELEKYYKQSPNSKLLFVLNIRPYYYFRGSKGKDSFIKKFKRNVLGEAPVFVDTLFIETTLKAMKAHLRTKGYYYSDITYEIIGDTKRHGTVKYHVQLNKQYKFGEVQLYCEDLEIYNIVSKSMSESAIRSWKPMEQQMLLAEQERIIQLLRNNGYYYMGKEYVDFDLDTSSAEGYCSVGINISNINDTTRHSKYYNGDVYVEIEPNSLSNKRIFLRDTISMGAFKYINSSYKLSSSVLDRNLLVRPNNEYRQQSLNRTYSRFSDLGIFRFVNIQTKPETGQDSNKVNYHVKMIPCVKYSFTFEPQATLSDQNNTLTGQDFRNYGVAFITSLSNRNIFGGAEVLQVSLRSAFEAQGERTAEQIGIFNATEQRLTTSITMPRALLLPKVDRNEKYYSTKTIVSIAGVYEVNIDYRRSALTLGYNYVFNKKLISYYFSPLEFSYIDSYIISDTLKKQSESDIYLQNLFTDNIILSTRIGFAYSNKSIAKGKTFFYFRWDVAELAGTQIKLINQLIGSTPNENGAYELFGIPYSEYIRSSIDFRYNIKLDVNNTTAFRTYISSALPFGNTPEQAPFDKRYYIGGPNDVRGWRPRTIGPGSFNEGGQIDYSGEVKILLSSDYRFNIYRRWFEGAFFLDAGNIWNAKKSDDRPNGEFQWDRFYKEFAISSGVGIRFNFDMIIIRFDFGIPLHDPSFQMGSRWVISKANPDWIWDNTNFNFGIGYPF
jgi:outer membrane protein assembly factor BamA